jgi:O-acetyl-ADP-ribose deacetylase (regulator of RNase III)
LKSMLEIVQGNLLSANVDALVNTVNCVGVMGKGIALQFKHAFPENAKQYERACRANELHPGTTLVVPTGELGNPRYIVNFPTKRHWKGDSKLVFIKAGLAALVRDIDELGISSIAIPPLGCGNGGLDWNDVFPLIEDAFASLPHVHALVFAPAGAPPPSEMLASQSTPKMTTARALLVKLIEQYREPGYALTLLEIQKLAYFLQECGQNMSLKFVKHTYGPYAEALNHALQRLEGTLIRGYGDRTKRAELELMPDAARLADEFLQHDPTASSTLAKVGELIQGFETPYGLELLATVHWVAKHDKPLANDPDFAVERVHSWNARKKRVFQADHIKRAWDRLSSSDCGLIASRM